MTDHPSVRANSGLVVISPPDGVSVTYSGAEADGDAETRRFVSVAVYPGGWIHAVDAAGEALMLGREHVEAVRPATAAETGAGR